MAEAAAAGRPYTRGRRFGPQKCRTEMLVRRRLRGKQTPMDARRFARPTYEALQAAKHAAPIASDRERLALSLAKDLLDALRAAVEQKKEVGALGPLRS